MTQLFLASEFKWYPLIYTDSTDGASIETKDTVIWHKTQTPVPHGGNKRLNLEGCWPKRFWSLLNFFFHLQKSVMTHVMPRATPVLSTYEMHLFRGEKRGISCKAKIIVHLAPDFSAAYLAEIRSNVNLMYMVMRPKIQSATHQNVQTTTKKYSHQSSTNIGTLTSFQRSKWSPLSHLLKCICPLTTDQTARFTLGRHFKIKTKERWLERHLTFSHSYSVRAEKPEGQAPVFPVVGHSLLHVFVTLSSQ